ncbi:MAG: hypothetical protein LBR50_09985 [Tannerella sp.]|jgi:hypothetical protein|nr:hypothetical protein [Tannerella sp.]
MTALLIDSSSIEAQSFLDFARTLSFVKSIESVAEPSPTSFRQAAAACNATSVDAFFDEVDSRIRGV